MRRRQAGSWGRAPLQHYATNPTALTAFFEREDFAISREGGGYDYDVARALEAEGTIVQYDGSAAETTSFGLKAISFYRELLSRRPSF